MAAKPEIRPNRKISAIWLLPFLALVLGGYLTYQSVNEAGIIIQIHFTDGEGIIEGKTPVKYKGLSVGKVKSIQPDRRLSGVNVLVEIDPRAEQALKQKTKFWLVKPQASLTRISGLDTILSGNYIAILPGGGTDAREFKASDEPPLQISGDDLLVQLTSDDPGSINVGSPVYHRHITVGEVIRVQLDEAANQVQVQLQIKSDYRHLVTEQSRFWNVSGLRLSASLSGVDIQTESLATLVAGGIAFDSPANAPAVTPEHAPFKLYPSLKEADRGLSIELTLPTAEGLALSNTEIRYLGLVVGKIEKLTLNASKTGIVAKAYLDPALEPFLGDESQFWLIKPKISVESMKNLETLVLGYQIQFSPASQSSSKRSFEVLDGEPAAEDSLAITLISNNSYGTLAGDPVMYKGLTIGRVTSLGLNQSDQVAIEVLFEPQYKEKIRTNSRFFVHSSVSLNAGLQQGLDFKVEPLDTLLTGGISLYQPAEMAESASPGAQLQLFVDEAAAQAGTTQKPLAIKLITEALDGLQTGALVYFKEFAVGEVSQLNLLPTKQVEVTLAIDANYQDLINDSSKFWQLSGIDLKATLSGIELKTSSLMALTLGGIGFDTPSPSAKFSGVTYPLFEDKATAFEQFQVVQVTAPVQSQLQQGNPVLYGGFEIGTIATLSLDENLNHLNAELHIASQYADSFTRESSQFWLESGHIGLDGLKNPSALLTGDFIAAKPGAGERRLAFELLPRPPLPTADDKQLVVYLVAPELGSISEGSPLLYRQKEIGQVVRTELSPEADQVLIQAQIQPEFTHLIRANTVFWNVSGIKADAGLFSGVEIQAESISTILNGGIALTTPGALDSQPKARFGSRFPLYSEAKQEWLK